MQLDMTDNLAPTMLYIKLGKWTQPVMYATKQLKHSGLTWRK